MKPVRTAGVDIGTNSVRILVADVAASGDSIRLHILHRLMNITRLGQGVDESGSLNREAIERTAAVLREYRALMREDEVEAWEVAATSAARDAANGDKFMSIVEEIMGLRPRMLSGSEEANLSFLGATYDLGELLPAGEAVLVVDIGGGSTELVVGRDGAILEKSSVDVGCVRMSERFLEHDPPLQRELEEMEEFVSSLLAPQAERITHWAPRLMVGLAGTVTTLSGLAQGLQRYDGDAVHHSWLIFREVQELYARLHRLPLAERKSFMRLEPGRADVIVGGTGVLLVLMRELGQERLLVSEKDILDGLAISAAGFGLGAHGASRT